MRRGGYHPISVKVRSSAPIGGQMRIFTDDGREVDRADHRSALERKADELLSQGRVGLARQVRKQVAAKARRKAHLAAIAAAPMPKRAACARLDEQGVDVIGAPGYPTKIGIAIDPDSRLRTIQTGCPERLKLYLFHRCPPGLARVVEQECHLRLADCRKSGEWFAVEWRDAVQMVETVAQRHTVSP